MGVLPSSTLDMKATLPNILLWLCVRPHSNRKGSARVRAFSFVKRVQTTAAIRTQIKTKQTISTRKSSKKKPIPPIRERSGTPIVWNAREGPTKRKGRKLNKKKKKRGSLPKEAIKYMRQWLFDHFQNPYPTEEEKKSIAKEIGLTYTQVNYWFINARVRIWRPMLQTFAGNAQNMKKPNEMNPNVPPPLTMTLRPRTRSQRKKAAAAEAAVCFCALSLSFAWATCVFWHK